MGREDAAPGREAGRVVLDVEGFNQGVRSCLITVETVLGPEPG